MGLRGILFLFSVLVSLVQCVQISYIGTHRERICGSAYLSGTVSLRYTHDSPPVTVFSEGRSRWRGPPLQILIEPDDRPGEFRFLEIEGRHIPNGLEIKGPWFDMCIRHTAVIDITVLKDTIQGINIRKK